jgi:hypothetical protein
LGATTRRPDKAINHPAIESFEKIQRSNEPVIVNLSFPETDNPPFLDSFLTTKSTAGKQ